MKLDSQYSRIMAAALFIGVLAVYTRVLFSGFITLDDGAYVFANANVARGWTMDGLASTFTAEVAGNWHPLTMLTHMTVCEFFGLRPWAHHLLNVVLHGINCVLLFKVLEELLWHGRQRLARDTAPAGNEVILAGSSPLADTMACGFAAALFALHPLRVESVAWVSELKDLLSALFWLLSIRAYLHWIERPAIGGYLAVLAFLLAGLMSKPMLVTLPFVLLLLDYWPLRRFSPASAGAFPVGQFIQLVVEKLPLFLVCSASCVVTLQFQQAGQAVQRLELYPLSLRVQSAIVSYAAYLGKLAWPVDLAVFYPSPNTLPWTDAGLAFLLILLLTVGAIFLGKRNPVLLTGWFWYLGTLVPVIGIVQVGRQAMADRYTYIPFTGLTILIAWAGAALLERRTGQHRWAMAAAGALLATCAVLTWRQLALWRSSEPLYRHALRVTRDNWFIHRSLGMLLAYGRRLDEGIEHLQKSVRIDSRNPGSWNDLALLWQIKGNDAEARQARENAIRLDPTQASAERGSLSRKKPAN